MSLLAQMEEKLKGTIKQAIIVAELAKEEELPEITLETPRDKEHGDFATNIAMQLARIARKAPRQIAEEIVANINKEEASIDNIDIAGPGFINFYMKSDYLGDLVEQIIEAGEDYGKTTYGKGKKVQVEFVSVNPTGRLHLGHARNAAFGDVLSNVLSAAGYEVEREYYINDAGSQIDNLGLSLEARYFQAFGKDKELPEDGYYGKDIIEAVEKLIETDGDKWLQVDEEERFEFFKEYGLRAMLEMIEEDLSLFRVHFDHWFSERSLYEGDQIANVLKTLKDKGYIFEEDGATWFKASAFNDDKDRVLIKKDGSYTYLTPDITYHQNKFDRGFDELINIWGGDHHGYIPRIEAAIQALGYDKEQFEVKVIQMVNIIEEGEKLRMSKRSGNAVTLRELLDEVGVDAVRYFFVARSNDTQLDFDTKLAKSQSNENPVYYVQYAHARICTMLKNAEAQGIDLDADFDATLLTTEYELDLLKKLGELPQVVTDSAKKRAPYQITQYVYDLASLLHRFYNAEKVLDTDNLDLTYARIALMKAVQITLANALDILDVTAPEKM